MLKATKLGSGRGSKGPGKGVRLYSPRRLLRTVYVCNWRSRRSTEHSPAGEPGLSDARLTLFPISLHHLSSPQACELLGSRGGATLTLDQRAAPAFPPDSAEAAVSSTTFSPAKTEPASYSSSPGAKGRPAPVDPDVPPRRGAGAGHHSAESRRKLC